MADGTEWLAVLQWAVARLTPTDAPGDAAVKALIAPSGAPRIFEKGKGAATYPQIFISLRSPGNDLRPNQGRILTDMLILVEAVDATQSLTGTLATLGAWIGAKMPTAVETTVGAGTIRGCHRLRPHPWPGPYQGADGKTYQATGGEYRVLVS